MTRISVAYPVAIVLVATAVASAAMPVGTAVAASGPSQFSVYQDGECTTVTPLGDGSETVESFYDYRVSPRYSSHGTTDIQQSGTSQLFLYNGSGGASLVFLHDAMGDETGGGTITVDVSGLPSGREWAVEDDDYEGQDDTFAHNGTRSHIEWVWAPNRTDGAAVRGLPSDGNVTIEPGFNEESDRWDTWNYTGDGHRIEKWIARSGDGSTHELSTAATVRVSTGACPSGGSSPPGDGDCEVGDANGDGSINAGDTVTVLQYRAGETSLSVPERCADANDDGSINAGDAIVILQYRAGTVSSLPT